jgi:hypothetical protein
VLFALDDTPTKRYGRQATPGPAEQKFLYGHIWVTLAWVVRHPRFGVIGLPLCARLYVRQWQMQGLALCYGLVFRTNLWPGGRSAGA